MIRTAEKYVRWNGDSGTRYYKYIPSNGVKPIGVILFYHGLGEISSTDLTLVERNGLPNFLAVDGVRAGVEIPFIVLCPQEEPPGQWYSRASYYVECAQSFGLPIHKAGLSLGSMIDAEIINTLGFNPFATIATCCGKINEFSNTMFELGVIPSYHAYDPADTTISNGYSSVKSVTDRLTAAGKDCKRIEYTGIGHSVWNKFYNPKEPTNYFDWLKSKTGTVVTPPAPVQDPIVETYLLDGVLTFKSASGKIVTK